MVHLQVGFAAGGAYIHGCRCRCGGCVSVPDAAIRSAGGRCKHMRLPPETVLGNLSNFQGCICGLIKAMIQSTQNIHSSGHPNVFRWNIHIARESLAQF
jgi:hypothetical protein